MFVDIGGSSIKIFKSELNKDLKKYVLDFDGKTAILKNEKKVLEILQRNELFISSRGKITKINKNTFSINLGIKNSKEIKIKSKLAVNDSISFAFYTAKIANGKYNRIISAVLGSGANAMAFSVEELLKRKNLWKQSEYGLWKINGKFSEFFVSEQFFKSLGYNPKNSSKKIKEKFNKNVAKWLIPAITLFIPEIIFIGGGLAKLIDLKILNNTLKGEVPQNQFEWFPKIKIIKRRDANLLGLKFLKEIYSSSIPK